MQIPQGAGPLTKSLKMIIIVIIITNKSSSVFTRCAPRCSIDPLTTMMENGDSQTARFSFSAFRFIEQQNETVSTYYLHCITRLCENAACSTFQVSDGPTQQAQVRVCSRCILLQPHEFHSHPLSVVSTLDTESQQSSVRLTVLLYKQRLLRP